MVSYTLKQTIQIARISYQVPNCLSLLKNHSLPRPEVVIWSLTMDSHSESQPITNGEQQIRNNEDRQETVTEGSSGKNCQTNIHSTTNLGTLTNSYTEKEVFGFNIKQIVRYVTIQVPSKKPKPDGQNVPDVETVGKKPLDPLPKRIKVVLKPPRKSNSEVILIADDNDFQETVEVVNVENPQTMSANNSSNDNLKAMLVDKKSVVDQETQTDIYGWLYKNGKLYSVISGKFAVFNFNFNITLFMFCTLAHQIVFLIHKAQFELLVKLTQNNVNTS